MSRIVIRSAYGRSAQREVSTRCLLWHPISVGWALIIHLIIQTIRLDPSGAVWTADPPNASRLNPSGAVQIDAEHPARNRKFVDSD
jgi:hypothetical protein